MLIITSLPVEVSKIPNLPAYVRLRLSVNSTESQIQVWLTWVLVWLKKQLLCQRNQRHFRAHRHWSLHPFCIAQDRLWPRHPARDKVVEHFLSSSGTIDMIWSTLPVDNSAKIQGPASSDDCNHLTLLQITSSSRYADVVYLHYPAYLDWCWWKSNKIHKELPSKCYLSFIFRISNVNVDQN